MYLMIEERHEREIQQREEYEREIQQREEYEREIQQREVYEREIQQREEYEKQKREERIALLCLEFSRTLFLLTCTTIKITSIFVLEKTLWWLLSYSPSQFVLSSWFMLLDICAHTTQDEGTTLVYGMLLHHCKYTIMIALCHKTVSGLSLMESSVVSFYSHYWSTAVWPSGTATEYEMRWYQCTS